jgi:hypothetical protein
MVPNFVSVTWHGDSFHGLVVQDVENLILLVLYFCLMEEGEEKERKKKRRKKIAVEQEVFPGAGPSLLAV